MTRPRVQHLGAVVGRNARSGDDSESGPGRCGAPLRGGRATAGRGAGRYARQGLPRLRSGRPPWRPAVGPVVTDRPAGAPAATARGGGEAAGAGDDQQYRGAQQHHCRTGRQVGGVGEREAADRHRGAERRRGGDDGEEAAEEHQRDDRRDGQQCHHQDDADELDEEDDGERGHQQDRRRRQPHRHPLDGGELLVEGHPHGLLVEESEGGDDDDDQHRRRRHVARPHGQHVAEEVGHQVRRVARREVDEDHAERHAHRPQDADQRVPRARRTLVPRRRAAAEDERRADRHRGGAQERLDAEEVAQAEAAERGVADAGAEEDQPLDHHQRADHAAQHAGQQARRQRLADEVVRQGVENHRGGWGARLSRESRLSCGSSTRCGTPWAISSTGQP
jgi:hypothetical protein